MTCYLSQYEDLKYITSQVNIKYLVKSSVPRNYLFTDPEPNEDQTMNCVEMKLKEVLY